MEITAKTHTANGCSIVRRPLAPWVKMLLL